MAPITVKDLETISREIKAKTQVCGGAGNAKITVHMGTCGIAAGAKAIMSALTDECSRKNIGQVMLTTSGCGGLCSREPMATVERCGEPPVTYIDLTPEKTHRILEEHVAGGKIVNEYALGTAADDGATAGFFARQTLVALKNRGLIDPEKIDEYIARDGYRGLAQVLTKMTPRQVIDEIKKSSLRGRGGGGFLTGRKWESCANARHTPKYIICNADEGDPGAYMDRSIIESDPHAMLEGMAIAAYAVGSDSGYVYIRTEYPLARERLDGAIKQARDYGLLGKNIFNTGFDFDVRLKQGAGAFVCGESSALRASIEGRAGEPSAKYEHATEKGLWQKPTVLNNVETFVNVPQIILRGAAWFTGMGTEKSKGTKVFSLVGNITNTGLIEVEMGTTLREIIYAIGGGIPNGKKFKAVQTGGPSGGCIPAEYLDTPVDFDELTKLGSMMGSGGMIVMDENACMVNVAKYFIEFCTDESCGKCTSCRDGSEALLVILERICSGSGTMEDVGLLEEISHAVKEASLCGLGTSLPNPVLSTLNYFRKEYERHIIDKKCDAGVCKALFQYRVNAETCKKCGVCFKNCPAGAIQWEKKEVARIIQEKCTKCGICYKTCKFNTIDII